LPISTRTIAQQHPSLTPATPQPRGGWQAPARHLPGSYKSTPAGPRRRRRPQAGRGQPKLNARRTGTAGLGAQH